MDLNHARLPIPPRGHCRLRKLQYSHCKVEYYKDISTISQFARKNFRKDPKTLKQYPYPIPSREDILALLRKAPGRHDVHAIATALSVKRQEMDGLMRRLTAMERDGQIRLDAGGRYQILNESGFISGRVSSHIDGYGFLIPDEGGEDIFLPEAEMRKVLHGDRVQVRVVGADRRGRAEGAIVEVLERANKHVIGRLLNEHGTWILAPEDRRINQDILISGTPGQAKSGEIVSVELIEQPSRYTQPIGRVVEVLGSIDDPGIEIEIAVRKFGVPHEFPEETKALAAKLPAEVREEDLEGRVDLRDIPLVTIDGEDARDFDDAVYCEPVGVNGADGFRLIVAIADVSHYVKPNDAIDVEALNRSTSVYFPRRVIPMLPEKLSNGLCSLNPAVDRLVLVCDSVIAADGEISAYQFYPAVMHSAARLTYTEVAAIIGNTKGPDAARRKALVPHLLNLYDLFRVLHQAREKRGAIDFEMVETYIVSNAQGKIEKILPRVRNDAHRLIEECMLAANVCAADLLDRHKHPGTYRIHAGPTAEKLNKLRSFLKQAGLSLGGGDDPAPADYAALMDKIKSRPDSIMIQTMMLRSMQQAVYSPDNIGHFGLAYDAYTHFTSPIRRYPDLLTHRVIKAILNGQRYEPKGIESSSLNTMVSPAVRKQFLKDKAEGKAKPESALTIWDALGIHCSANERRADEASRDVEAWLKCYFIRDKLGEHFTGTVSGVTSFGIFVQLDDIFIEGMVHISDLGADYFEFDEARHELRGERTGKRYQLTNRVTVQVSRVDLDARRIDLRLVDEPGRGSGGGRPKPRSDARRTPFTPAKSEPVAQPVREAPPKAPAIVPVRKTSGGNAGQNQAKHAPIVSRAGRKPKTSKSSGQAGKKKKR